MASGRRFPLSSRRIFALLLGLVLLLAIAAAPVSSPSELQRIRDWNRLGDYAKAEHAARKLLAEVERDHGAESLEAAEVLDELSVAFRRGGKVATDEAVRVALRAVDLKRRVAGASSPGYAMSLKNLGMLRLQRDEVALVEAPLLESARIYETANGPDDPGLAAVLAVIGVFREREGRYAESRALIERSLTIRRKAFGENHPDVAESVNALASIEYELGDLVPALAHFQEALAIWTRTLGPKHPSVSTGHNNLGAIADEMGDLDRSRQEYERALDLRRKYLGPNHPLTAWTAHNLGTVYVEQGDSRKALQYFEQSLRINTAVYGPRGEPLARSLWSMGEVRLASGDVKRASEAMNRAYEITKSAYDPDHAEMGWALDDLGHLDEKLGNYEAARAKYERSLEIRTRVLGPRHPDLSACLMSLARVAHHEGHSDSSFALALRAAAIYRDQLKLTLGALSERQALAFAARRAGAVDLALSFVGPKMSAERSRDLWDAVFRERNLVLDEMTARRHASASTKDSTVARAWRELAVARGELTTLLVRGGTSDDQVAQIRRARERAEAAERKVAGVSRSYRSERKVLDAGWADLASVLPKNEGIIAYSAYHTEESAGYVAFAMLGGSRPVAVPLGKAATIEAAVREWTTLVGRPPSGSGMVEEKAARRAGTTLRRLVWDPVIDRIGPVNGLSRLSIVPDGAICRVSFAALPQGATGYLVETCPQLRYLGAGRDLIPRPVGKPGVGLLALGDAAYGTADRRPRGAELRSDTAPLGAVRFTRLSETGEEVADIASQWPRRDEVTVLSGARASESAWKQLAPGKLVLHLATHAFFLDGSGMAAGAGTRGIGGTVPSDAGGFDGRTNPLKLSGLALAGANRRNEAPSTDDGMLTADEVASLDLEGVSWAVLSACNTGGGEIQAGEGVIGLRRAFQVAGVRAVVMSLWPVEDRATRDWMERLYRLRFREGRSAADAVLRADRGLLGDRRARGQSTHPFYWAAFVASGNDGTSPEPGHK